MIKWLIYCCINLSIDVTNAIDQQQLLKRPCSKEVNSSLGKLSLVWISITVQLELHYIKFKVKGHDDIITATQASK